MRFASRGGSLTGAHRPGDDAAREIAADALRLRDQLAEETRTYLGADAPDLRSLLRRTGDPRLCGVVDAALTAMGDADDWFGDVAHLVGRASQVLLRAGARPGAPEPERRALRRHARRLGDLRRLSAEIIHLKLHARMAAHRARRGVVAAQSASPSASVAPCGRPQTSPTETAP